MCEPVSAVMTAVSTAMGALQASAQARYAARIADRNADMEREAAQQDIANTQEQAQAHYRQLATLKGAQRARAAANGVGVDWGTAGDLQAETEALGREDIGRIYRQGHERLRTRDIGASNYAAEANAQRSASRAVLAKGVLDLGSSVLGNSAQFGGQSGQTGRRATVIKGPTSVKGLPKR